MNIIRLKSNRRRSVSVKRPTPENGEESKTKEAKKEQVKDRKKKNKQKILAFH